MKKTHFNAVLSDRDGTILQSETFRQKLLKETFGKHGKTISVDDLEYILGRTRGEFLPEFACKYNVEEEVVTNEFNSLYEKDFKHIPLFENVTTYLGLLPVETPCILVTSAHVNTTSQFIDRPEISNLFDFAITHEDTEKHKPDPEPFLLAAERVGVSPDDCLVLEDSLPGVLGAKAAGMTCLAVNVEPSSKVAELADYHAKIGQDLRQFGFTFTSN